MSSKPKRGRPRKKKSLEDQDFSPPSAGEAKTNAAPTRRRNTRNNNAVAKGQLELIVQMLESSEQESLDERTMRYNVKIAVRNLKKVVGLL